MNSLFNKSLILLLFIMLLIQCKSISNIKAAEAEKVPHDTYKDSVKNASSASPGAIKINDLLELMYSIKDKITVDNININESAKTAEIEISFEGNELSVEEVYNKLSNNNAFKEVKKYIENDNKNKKMYLTYNLIL